MKLIYYQHVRVALPTLSTAPIVIGTPFCFAEDDRCVFGWFASTKPFLEWRAGYGVVVNHLLWTLGLLLTHARGVAALDLRSD
jgi:hypothetical protein